MKKKTVKFFDEFFFGHNCHYSQMSLLYSSIGNVLTKPTYQPTDKDSLMDLEEKGDSVS